MARRHSPPDENTQRFAEFFTAHHAGLVRFLMQRGATDSDARDVAQKAYLALLNARESFFAARLPKAYLWTVAMREWSRLRRHNQEELRHVVVDTEVIEFQGEHPEHIDPDALAGDLIRNEDMLRAYASLSREEKNVCNLMGEGMGAEEIAEATGLSRDRTERCITRVRKRLKGLS